MEITITIDNQTKLQIEDLARTLELSESELLIEAFQAYSHREAAFAAKIREGLKDLDEGRVIAHDDLKREFRQKLADLG